MGSRPSAGRCHSTMKPLALIVIALAVTSMARPGLAAGTTPTYPAGGFRVSLRSDTGTLASLAPRTETDFDYVPAWREAQRQGNGYVQVGDLNLRLRDAGGTWRDFASSQDRKPIQALATPAGTLSAADMTLTMGDGIPLRIERRWLNVHGVLTLRFTLTNTSANAVEVGGLGMPMVFDNILTDRTLDEAHAHASFVDPYIGRDAGYLQ